MTLFLRPREIYKKKVRDMWMREQTQNNGNLVMKVLADDIDRVSLSHERGYYILYNY